MVDGITGFPAAMASKKFVWTVGLQDRKMSGKEQSPAANLPIGSSTSFTLPSNISNQGGWKMDVFKLHFFPQRFCRKFFSMASYEYEMLSFSYLFSKPRPVKTHNNGRNIAASSFYFFVERWLTSCYKSINLFYGHSLSPKHPYKRIVEFSFKP